MGSKRIQSVGVDLAGVPSLPAELSRQLSEASGRMQAGIEAAADALLAKAVEEVKSRRLAKARGKKHRGQFTRRRS